MTSYPFLSPAWVEAARELRAEFADRLPAPPMATKINVVVTDVPDSVGAETVAGEDAGSGQVMNGHIDTTSGRSLIDEGHVEGAELTVTVDYETARATFVTRDPEAVMSAFFRGKILAEGDATVLMALQATPPEGDDGDLLIEMYDRLEALTE